jgi:hypothetical protein
MPDNGIKVKLRFNKPILADIVGEAAKNLLQSIEDRHRSGLIGDSCVYLCLYICIYKYVSVCVYTYIQTQRICYSPLKIDTKVD